MMLELRTERWGVVVLQKENRQGVAVQAERGRAQSWELGWGGLGCEG